MNENVVECREWIHDFNGQSSSKIYLDGELKCVYCLKCKSLIHPTKFINTGRCSILKILNSIDIMYFDVLKKNIDDR